MVAKFNSKYYFSGELQSANITQVLVSSRKLWSCYDLSSFVYKALLARYECAIVNAGRESINKVATDTSTRFCNTGFT